MNEFLKNREQINSATKWLQDNGLQESGLSCKNWEGASVLQYLKDGSLLDMGSDGGIILENAVKLKIKGKKFGIDLAYRGRTFDVAEDGILYMAGNLINTPFARGFMDSITCMSVIEHDVKFDKIAKECSYLLKEGGNLFISFDYWSEKINTKGILLYNLEWNILCKEDVENLIEEFKNNGLELTSDIDWTTQDAVINKFYCAPTDVEYTFGIFKFVKK